MKLGRSFVLNFPNTQTSENNRRKDSVVISSLLSPLFDGDGVWIQQNR